MAMFTYPRSEPEDSFGIQLLKSLLANASGALVSGGIQGGLGDYFKQKAEGRQLAAKTDLAEKVANQNQAMSGRAEVKDFLKDMPDKKRAWNLYQNLKDNPELISADLGVPAQEQSTALESANQSEQMTSGPGGLPTERAKGMFFNASKPAPSQVPLKAINPLDQYAQEDPEGYAQWNMGKEARDVQNKGILAQMLANSKAASQGQRETFLGNQGDLNRDAKIKAARLLAEARKAAAAKKADEKSATKKLSDDPKFKALGQIYAATERGAVNPVTGIIDPAREPARNAAKKAFLDYALGVGASTEDIQRALAAPGATFPGPTPGPMTPGGATDPRDAALDAITKAAKANGLPMPTGPALDQEINNYLAKKKR